jgi:hypothetical protein
VDKLDRRLNSQREITMQTIWHSLAWKEWHEHKWKLAALNAIVIAITAGMYCAFKRADLLELTAAMAFGCLMPLTIYVAASVATAERSRHTAPLLAALPVPSWQAGIAKLVFGSITCISPLLPALFIVTWNRPPLPPPFADKIFQDTLPFFWRGTQWVAPWTWCLFTTIIDASVIASLFVWTAATAAKRKDEVSGTAVAIATVGSLWTICLFATFLLRRFGLGLWRNPAMIISSALPGGLTYVVKSNLPLSILIAAVISGIGAHYGLAVWFVRHFTSAVQEREWPSLGFRARSNFTGLALPWRSKFSAIVWKQLREIGPPLTVGITAVTCVIVAIVLGNRAEYSEPRRFLDLLASAVVYVGFITAMTVGIGALLNDLGPQLNTFWRSRPINPDLWFWTRFCLVPLVVLLMTALPMAVGAWCALPTFDEIGKWFQPEFIVIVSVLLCLYASAVAMTCLLRNAVYAAVLSIALLAAPFVVVWLIWLLVVPLRLVPAPRIGAFGSFSIPAAFAILVVTTAAATVLSWLAVRYDWGQKN